MTTPQPSSPDLLAERLARLVRLPTVAPGGDEPFDAEATAAFAGLHALLRELYPVTFRVAETEVVGRAGLLLRIAGGGADPSRSSALVGTTVDGLTGATAFGPAVLMAHQDVVPAPKQDEDWAAQGWSHPPFAGVVLPDADGALTVYGRGTLDDKGELLVLLEAVENLLDDGWLPHHDLYLLFGCDEERDGPSAQEATRLLAERGVAPAFVLDEGGAVVHGLVPGMRAPVAVVGTAEKGVLTLEIVVETDPRFAGHASTPPRRGVTAALGRVVAALEANPAPAVVDDVAVATLTGMAPHLPWPQRTLLARAGRLRGPFARLLPLLGPEMAAMVRTTSTTTILQAGSAPNVIASRARAVVNLRLATTSSIDDAVAHVTKVARRAARGRGWGRGRGAGPPGVEVRVLAGSEPTPASPLDERWELVGRAVRTAYPDAVPVPYTMLAASDSRHVAQIADAIYRFCPFEMTPQQRRSIHGVDEHVTADSLVRGVVFYRALLAG